jgi:hypothetical protein
MTHQSLMTGSVYHKENQSLRLPTSNSYRSQMQRLECQQDGCAISTVPPGFEQAKRDPTEKRMFGLQNLLTCRVSRIVVLGISESVNNCKPGNMKNVLHIQEASRRTQPVASRSRIPQPHQLQSWQSRASGRVAFCMIRLKVLDMSAHAQPHEHSTAPEQLRISKHCGVRHQPGLKRTPRAHVSGSMTKPC